MPGVKRVAGLHKRAYAPEERLVGESILAFVERKMSTGKCFHLWRMTVMSFLMLAGLTLTLVALLTDSWYQVTTTGHQEALDPQARRHNNYHFGLWRLCYDQNMPEDIASASHYQKEGSSCIFIYDQLIHKAEHTLDADSQLRLHLSRAALGCSIACASCILFALLSMLCGMWPSSRQSLSKQSCVYLAIALLLLLATMSGISSGVSFMAVRDLDNTLARRGVGLLMPPAAPVYAHQSYAWSFCLHWTATAMVFLDSLLAVCMLRMDSSYTYTESTSKLKALDGL